MRSLLSLCLSLLFALPTLAADDVLRVGLRGLPPGLGNPYTANGTPSSYTWGAMFDALTRLDRDAKLVPGLATEWEAVDELTWRFTLREGVTFQDGTPLTADAVVAMVDWLLTDEGRTTVVGAEIRSLAGAEAVDDRTVLIRTAVPDAILGRRMAAALIVEPTRWAERGPDGFAEAPIGTGPYRLRNWASGDGRVQLDAYAASWRAPILPRLDLVELPEGAARMQAIVSGQIDLTTVTIEDIPVLERRGLTVEATPGLQVMSIAFRTVRDAPHPIQDMRVRQALNHAIDKRAMAEVLLLGLADPASQPAAQETNGHNPALEPYAYDPAKARALLAEAGYGDGFEMELEVIVNSVPGDAAIYQTVAQMWGAVGVKTTLQSRPFAAWLQDYVAGTFEVDGFGLSWNATPYNDVIRPMEIFSCAKANPFFCDESVMPAIAEVNRTFDDAERLEKLQALSARYRELAPAAYLIEQVDLFAHSAKLQGFAVANRVPIYEDISFAD